MDRYIVELEPGVWYAEWSGDPGRTLDRRFAKVFETYDDAVRGKARARRMRPFKSALIQAVQEPDRERATRG
jgi:hypothetical protein